MNNVSVTERVCQRNLKGKKPIIKELEKLPRLPTTMEFRIRLLRLEYGKAERSEDLPPVPENPTASDMARYGWVDWERIKHSDHPGHGQGLINYLHDMAKLMMTREGYTGFNARREEIEGASMRINDDETQWYRWIGVRNNWEIVGQGRHRVLVLKILGQDFVEKSGMNDWVKIWKIKS